MRNSLGAKKNEHGKSEHFALLLVVIVAMIFFGRGRVPDLMGDMGKGIANLRRGLAETRNVETASEIENRLTKTNS